VPAGSPAAKRSEHLAEWSTNASSSLVGWLDLKLRTCGSARVQETGSMQKPHRLPDSDEDAAFDTNQSLE
jgi:hypothetical protein